MEPSSKYQKYMTKQEFEQFKSTLPKQVTLVAVSKTYPKEDIQQFYDWGQRDFGENRVQELLEKQPHLPKDIHWHCIGHLQTNKVKFIIPFIHLIHSVDSMKLLNKIESESAQNNTTTQVLLQIKIAEEETKYGLSREEAEVILKSYDLGEFPHVQIKGLMGMASFVDDVTQVKREFSSLSTFYNYLASQYNWDTLSMGMSGDYPVAIEQGSTMIRVGSLLFGKRNY